MLKIIRADIYRILRGKALYITLAVLLATGALLVGTWSSAQAGGITVTPEAAAEASNIVAIMEEAGATGVSIPQALAISMENFTFFLLSIIIIVAGAMFSHNTVKNDIAWGVSRTKLYFSKLLLTVFICILMLLFYVGTCMLMATIWNGFGGPAPAGHWVGLLQIFAAQLVLLIALVAFGVFLAFTTKRTAAVNGLFIAFCLVPPLVISLLMLGNPNLSRLMDFDMLTNIMRLAHLPSMENREILRALGLGMFYLVASTTAGVALFRRTEIK